MRETGKRTYPLVAIATSSVLSKKPGNEVAKQHGVLGVSVALWAPNLALLPQIMPPRRELVKHRVHFEENHLTPRASGLSQL
jgi:hypothetical protein